MLDKIPSDAPRASADHRIPAYDGVRGIAILLILLYHFASSLTVLGLAGPILDVFQFGWCGVDVFFALSGFLITGILLDSKSSPNSFRSFYSLRVLRIFPLCYGALLIVFLLRTAFSDAGVWGVHDTLWAPGSLVWPALFLENVPIAIWGPDATGLVTHYWSLAVEEHFYLLWPLLIWIAPRNWAAAFSILAAVGSIAGRALALHRGLDTDLVFGITPLRMDGLAIGALGAIVLRAHPAVALTRPAMITFITGLAMATALFVLRKSAYQSDPVIWIWGYPIIAICTTAALLASTAGGWLARLLSLPLLRWFGKYSFGLYVWHPIVGMLLFHSRLALVPAGAPAPVIVIIVALVFALNLGVAWVSFHFWEKYFLDFKRYIPATTAKAVPARDIAVHLPVSEF